MNFSSLILDFLKQHGQVQIPGFGTFYLKNTNALVAADGQMILPPGKEVAFKADHSPADRTFAQFIAQQKNTPLIDAEIEIKKQTNFWYSILEKEGKFVLENVGTFILDDSQIHFKGNRTGNLSPDFYGLEEINLSDIKNSSRLRHNSATQNSYRFRKTVYWLVPTVLAVSALAYFSVVQPEMLFGKTSFGNIPEKKTVSPIVKDSVKQDSATIANTLLDSAKTDSAKSAVVAPVPVKKWSSKKYSKSKWKKAKKRQNR